MEHKIDILQHRVWSLGIYNFEYYKGTKRFTIGYNNLIRIIGQSPTNKILPREIVIHNYKTKTTKRCYVDAGVGDSVYIDTQSTNHQVRYYFMDIDSPEPYTLDVIIDSNSIQ